MHPRPILKRSSSSSTSSEKHAVHFPPSPALTRTFAAHSPAAYDRSPIVVIPNACALPERGGRTYVLDEQPSRRRSLSKSGRVLHPRVIRDSLSLPPLIQDLSSESDESDAIPSPHLENHEFFFGLNTPQQPDDAANLLSFLPYAPTNPYQSDGDEAQEYLENTQRHRKERRWVAMSDEEDQQDATPRRRRSRSKLPCKESSLFSSNDSLSSFALRDDGCLGGF